MAATLFDLIAIPTQDDFVRQRLQLLAVQNFPIAAWQPGGVAETLIETEAIIDADQARLVPVLCASGFLDYAQGAWLDLKAESDYDEFRKPAVATIGRVRVADVGGVGPLDIDAGDLVVLGPNGEEYQATADFTVPLNGSVSVPVQARQLGSQGNVGVNTIQVFGTDHPGLSVSNVVYQNGSWITKLGADAESDEDLAERCRLKWSALGSGSNSEAYRYHALSIDGIRRAKATEGGALDGRVEVLVAGSTGPATDEAYAACNALIQEKRPLGIRVTAVNAYAYPVTMQGVVKVRASFLATARALVNANLLAYLQRLDLGETFLVSQAIEEIMAPAGVVDVRLTAPSDDVTPPDGSCLTLTNLLTFVAV